MNKLTILLVLFAPQIFAQTATCRFEDQSLGYTCVLFITNPDGSENFEKIHGEHLPGFTNERVFRIVADPSSNTKNIPSIICNSFPFPISIDLSSSGIEEVGANSFSGCVYTTQIRLNNNKIRKIAERAFDPIKYLTYINLDMNEIEELPKNILTPLTTLETLILSRNKLKVIQSDIFVSKRMLSYIDLRDNEIDAVSRAILDNTVVRHLDMYGNKCVSETFTWGSAWDAMLNGLKKCFENYEKN